MLTKRQIRQRQAAGRASYRSTMDRLAAEFGAEAEAEFSRQASARGKLGGRPNFHEALRKERLREEARRAGYKRRWPV